MFALNPALILHGSTAEIGYAIVTILISGAYLSWAAEGSMGALQITRVERIAALVLALVTGTSTLWVGSASPLNIGVIAAGLGLMFAFAKFAARRTGAAAVAAAKSGD